MPVQVNGSPANSLCSSNVTEVFQTLFRGMRDYTTDSRGDIGSVLVVGVVLGGATVINSY